VFDGKGHVIQNAVVNLPGIDAVALLGYLRHPGTILNLGVEDVAITGRSRIGGLVAVSSGGEVTGCHVSGSVTGSKTDIGGLVAFNAFGTIQSSYTVVTVYTPVISGNGSIGGLTGYNWGTIRSCYATGPVTGHGTVGGLVGYNAGGGTVVDCHASGLVSSVYDAGGLVGQNSGIVADSYATGNQASQWHVGGCVGWNNQGKVMNCYSAGIPSGSTTGGFCGYINTGGNYEDVGNFWDTETSLSSGSAMGTGKTTAEMKTKSTYTAANWDFVETWTITEGVSYPWLRPVVSGEINYSADLNRSGKVDLEDFALFASQWLTGDSVPLDMVPIPNGTFEMGDSFAEGGADELPVHTVTLNRFSQFYMGKYEITNGQYCAFLNSALKQGLITVDTFGVVYQAGSGTNYPYYWTYASSFYSQMEFSAGDEYFFVRMKNGRSMANDPVVCVSWYGAAAYSNWRSRQEDRESCYDLSTWVCDFTKSGYRLPTEAEWEYAARGGLSGKRFPWGDTISHSQANYESPWSGGVPVKPYDVSPTEGYHPIWNDGKEPYTSPAGIFVAGSGNYGLYDITGNVREWCNDWYDNYGSRPQTDPTGPETGTSRVLRGGSWYDWVFDCRVSSRNLSLPALVTSHSGFRIALGL
jgi:formylglycine-generating enzyme required for sulfatase activity